VDRITRPKLPTLDQADRKVLGVAIILVLCFALACIVVGAGLGAGVFAFRLLSGMGG
jgi:hypothetical protein